MQTTDSSILENKLGTERYAAINEDDNNRHNLLMKEIVCHKQKQPIGTAHVVYVCVCTKQKCTIGLNNT